MRPWRFLLPVAVVLLGAGAAVAQGADDVEPGVTVTITPFGDSVQPLEEIATTDATVTITCSALAHTAMTPTQVDVHVTEAPSWATVTVSPSSVPAALRECTGTTWETTVQVHVSTTAEAPAFEAGTIGVEARMAGAAGNVTGSAATDVEAGYFSILSATPAETIFSVKPAEAVEATVIVGNFGNGATKVRAEVVEAQQGWTVALPAPAVLGSKVDGEASTTDLLVRLQPPRERGYVNDVAAFTLRFASAYAVDPDLVGEEKTVALLVTVRGLDVPAPPYLAAAGVAALLLGRGRSNRPAATI